MQMVGRTADAHVMWIMRKTVLSTSLSPVLECQSDIITITNRINRKASCRIRAYVWSSQLPPELRFEEHGLMLIECGVMKLNSPKDPKIQKEKATIV